MGDGISYSKSTLKVKSKMATNRIKMKLQKKANKLLMEKKNIALLISNGKMQSARIKVEGIIREENIMMVMEWLELMCDLIHQRVNLISKAKLPPEDLLETMCSILYCAERISVPELMEISKQFGRKYGEKWIKRNKENRSGMVARKIENALSSKPPTMEEAQKKLIEIAEENDVEMPETEEQAEIQIVKPEIQVVKPEQEEKIETDPIMVNRMVEILSDPKEFDISDDQKMEMMRKKGCNEAEAAAALYIITEKYRNGTVRVKQTCMQPLATNEGGSGSGEAKGSLKSFTEGPPPPPPTNPDANSLFPSCGSIPDFNKSSGDVPGTYPVTTPFGSSPVHANPVAPPGETKISNDPALVKPQSENGNGVLPGEPEEGENDYDDLEARFAALQKK